MEYGDRARMAHLEYRAVYSGRAAGHRCTVEISIGSLNESGSGVGAITGIRIATEHVQEFVRAATRTSEDRSRLDDPLTDPATRSGALNIAAPSDNKSPNWYEDVARD